MRSIYLIEGPVGAGKSTFARTLAAQLPGVHVALDEWFVRLFSPDRPANDFVPWYVQRKERLIDLIWDHALDMATTRLTPVLELGLIQRQARHALYQRAERAHVQLHVRVLDAPQEVRWERVQRRNEERGATFSMVVPQPVFDMASSLWEPPDDDEIRDYGIELVCPPAG